mmetsp:Transcript_5490/g.3140  ORF Transcript_5490/g.3140 Transcript_5490/m.3140 type:complete len:151 (+) Transcript_5490:97-549(+)
MEILVRIAIDKYKKNKIVETCSDAFKKLMVENILPEIKDFNENDWRFKEYCIEEVDKLYKKYLPILNSLYAKYSGKNTLPGKTKFMSLEEWTNLINDAGLIKEGYFTARDIDIAYNTSMMTQVNELSSKRHLEMSFIEFAEAIARAANLI